MNTLSSILGLSLLGSVLGLAGGLLVLWKEKLARRMSLYLISFAAGVILSVALLDLLPEAIIYGGENVFILILVGMVSFFLAEDFILHFHHHESHPHPVKPVAPLLILGDSIHNFIDGVAIAAAFMADPKLGFIVAVATFFHEIPQEIGDFVVLLQAGMSKQKVLLANLFSAFMTFAGALLTYFSFNHSRFLMGPLLAVSTGMFLYISSADILPELVKKGGRNRWRVASLFLSGIILVFFLGKLLPG
ncbi:MAG: ZIP family metal transporter [bacterium]|nr:ZIP family metal transporter [bacterium]